MKAQRLAKWDNIKFFMILSVVIGHTIYEFRGESDLLNGIYLFIYTYHMPVFIFVAGLFSKNTIKDKKYNRVLEYVIIYLVMKLCDAFGNYILGKGVKVHLFWEAGPGWFAFAMAAFLLATMLLEKVDKKFLLMAAILLGCAAGLDTHLGSLKYGNHFVAMRIFVFYPVFLAGYYLDAKKINTNCFGTITKTILRLSSFVFLNLVLFICIFKTNTLFRYIDLLKGKCSYNQIVKAVVDGKSIHMGLDGVIYRLLIYGLWAILIFAVILVNSEKEHIYTWLGTRTMSIFIWHKLVITIVLKKFGLIEAIKNRMPNTYVFAAICIGIMICIITAYFPEIRIPDAKEK